MSDDQVGYESVSVSSVTGIPGLSRTKDVKWLCVCVRACVCNNNNKWECTMLETKVFRYNF